MFVYRKMSAAALIVILAGCVDAFQSLSLRPFVPSAKGSRVSGVVRLRTGPPMFLQNLKASATSPISKEKMYEIAQVIIL